MATTDDTFDPNDLQSIDALLDEAELEAVSDLPEDDADFDVDEMLASQDLPDAEDLSGAQDADEDLLASLDDLVLDDNPEPEVVGVSEPEVEQSVIPEPAVPVNTKKDIKPDSEALPDADEILSKRASTKASQNSNLSAEDMDSIKKLIIIFGSVLSVLALSAIGIGLWGALAASSAGIDEETQVLIESIKVSSDQSGLAAQSAEKTALSVEKKLDAINFQLEQLASDVAEMDSKSMAAKDNLIDPLGLGTAKAPEAVAPVTAPVANSAPIVTNQNKELMDSVSSVNRKMISAQRRIDEVNNRVKKIQSQYDALIHSVKTVEKQVLIEQAEKAEQLESKKQAADKNRYQYTAPDGVMYDQSVTDSYP